MKIKKKMWKISQRVKGKLDVSDRKSVIRG